jgi:hypothetical protein
MNIEITGPTYAECNFTQSLPQISCEYPLVVIGCRFLLAIICSESVVEVDHSEEPRFGRVKMRLH